VARTFTLALAPVFGLIMLAGCNRPGPALAYNQALVEGTQRLTKAGEGFGRAAGAALVSSNDADIARADQSFQELKNTIKAVQSDTKSLTVPPGQAAKELSEAFDRFLQQQEESVNKEFKEMLDVVKDKKTGLAEKQKRFNQILSRASQGEQGSLAPLQAAQQKFAREHNVTLKK
jgi:hypothetical protein